VGSVDRVRVRGKKNRERGKKRSDQIAGEIGATAGRMLHQEDGGPVAPTLDQPHWTRGVCSVISMDQKYSSTPRSVSRGVTGPPFMHSTLQHI
jgi:hypothetical protein